MKSDLFCLNVPPLLRLIILLVSLGLFGPSYVLGLIDSFNDVPMGEGLRPNWLRAVEIGAVGGLVFLAATRRNDEDEYLLSLRLRAFTIAMFFSAGFAMGGSAGQLDGTMDGLHIVALWCLSYLATFAVLCRLDNAQHD